MFILKFKFKKKIIIILCYIPYLNLFRTYVRTYFIVFLRINKTHNHNYYALNIHKIYISSFDFMSVT